MAFDTLDCVVVGAEYGHGKRKDVLSDYTFAVRDDSRGELKTIGKAYSGLTDLEIAELTAHFLSHVVQTHGRYHEVVPDTVLEIASIASKRVLATPADWPCDFLASCASAAIKARIKSTRLKRPGGWSKRLQRKPGTNRVSEFASPPTSLKLPNSYSR